LGATAFVVLVGAVTLFLFAIGVDRTLLAYPLHHYGTLPPGDYPRLELTFKHPAMMCNYLTVSLMMLFVCRRLGWIGLPLFIAMFAGICLSAAFGITPGLGGIVLAVGFWLWLSLPPHRRLWRRLSLVAGVAGALLFLLSATITPIVHPTAPFLITLPWLDLTVAPAARLTFWIDAWSNFLDRPVFGRGIGTDAIDVVYQNPAGVRRPYTDAHNMFLNLAAQCGVIGLLPLLLLIGKLVRQILPLRLGDQPSDVLRMGLGSAFLNAFVYQGLAGSFEDTRHLWLLLGLFLASGTVSRSPTQSPAPSVRGVPRSADALPEAR
jgi:O-antigen ligase